MFEFFKFFEKAKQLQEELQERLSRVRVEGSSGAGMVRVVMDGAKNVLELEIDPQLLKPEEREMLQDLIIAALNDAGAKAEEEMKKILEEMGLPFGGLF